MDTAHIYSQPFQHCEAYIVADEKAIRAIIEAASKALYHTLHEKVELSCNDGEGYDLHIILLEDKGRWRKMAEPYNGDVTGAQDGRLWPWQLITTKEE